MGATYAMLRLEIWCVIPGQDHVSVVQIPVQHRDFQMLCTSCHIGGWMGQSCATWFPLLVLLWLAQCAWEEPSSRTEHCSLYSPCAVMSCSHAGPAIIWSGRSSKHVFVLLIKYVCSFKCASQKCWLPLGVAQGIAIGKAGVFVSDRVEYRAKHRWEWLVGLSDAILKSW